MIVAFFANNENAWAMSAVAQRMLMKRVAAISGGPDQAAAKLGVSLTVFNRFRSGAMPLPEQVERKALEIILENSRELLKDLGSARKPPTAK